jgi:hypothetical protein
MANETENREDKEKRIIPDWRSVRRAVKRNFEEEEGR